MSFTDYKTYGGTVYTTLSSTTGTGDRVFYDSANNIEWVETFDAVELKKKKTNKSKKYEYTSPLTRALCEKFKPPRKLNMASFFRHKSGIFKADSGQLARNKINVHMYQSFYFNQYIHIDQNSPLGTFDITAVVDVLEYVPNMMDAANILKEALTALRIDKVSEVFLIIAAKSRAEVKNLAMKEKYLPFGDGYMRRAVIEHGKEKIHGETEFIRGYDAEELENLALFAGAKKILKAEFLEDLGFPCIAVKYR